MPYVLNMTKQHRQSLIELVNFDNQGTIQTDLTLSDVLIRSERAVPAEEILAADGQLVNRAFAVTLEKKNYALDTVEVYFNKVNLPDVMDMTSIDGDFNWYDPDTWVDATSPALAVAAFKVAAARAGIDADSALENLAASRTWSVDNNYYYLIIDNASYVFNTGASFKMPKHLSEVITQTTLDGFIFLPIAAEDVIA